MATFDGENQLGLLARMIEDERCLYQKPLEMARAQFKPQKKRAEARLVLR
jgi:hypothetical protein